MEAILAAALALVMLPTGAIVAFGPLVFCALVFRATVTAVVGPLSTERVSPFLGFRLWLIMWSGSAALFFGCLELLRRLA